MTKTCTQWKSAPRFGFDALHHNEFMGALGAMRCPLSPISTPNGWEHVQRGSGSRVYSASRGILASLHLEEFIFPEVSGFGDISQAFDHGCQLLISRLQSIRHFCSADTERLHLLLMGSHLLCVGKVPASARELRYVCPLFCICSKVHSFPGRPT